MASEKQSQKRLELRRGLDTKWKKYERMLWDAPRDLPDNLKGLREELTELRRDIERDALFIYLNND